MKPLCQLFWLSSSLVLLCLAITNPLQAQIASDGTLSTNSTTTDNLNFTITNGNRAGGNLFHSFRKFSVPTGGSAVFNNAPDIQNIINRVTGSSVSNIDGLLKANGTANLFLLNPNGVIFGPNASLNIGGSFLASTASSLNFADNTQFSVTAPQAKPLLTVSAPIGLQFGRAAGSIRNQSQASPGGATNSLGLPVGLKVQPGKTLALVGNDVALENGNLTAAGGWIELGSVAGVGEVSLSQSGNNWSLGYDSINAFGDIRLEGEALIDVSGEEGGNLQIQAAQLEMTQGSAIFADTLGSGDGGEVFVRTTEGMALRDGSLITAGVLGSGTGGNLTIETRRLLVQDGAQVLTTTFSPGKAGNLTVQNAMEVELVGGIVGADGKFISSGLFAQTEAAEATGTGGNLSISTEKLTVRDGAQVNSTTFGVARAGDLTVQATDVELAGVALSADGEPLTIGGLPFPSGLFAGTNIGSSGNGGTLTVETDRLSLREGAVVQTSTLGEGNAGNLSIQASEIELIGTAKGSQFPTSLLAVSGGIPGFPGVAEATGKGGDLSIETGELIVQDGAAVAVSSLNPTSDAKGAGTLAVQAQTIRLNNEGRLTSETASGDGGDITLQDLDLLLLSNNSQISTTAGTAQTGGDGGNITIDTDNLVALENSDITANAFQGRGGQVRIDAQGIFGTEFRERENPATSDITASSRFGVSGTVELNTPDVDPSQGLVALPEEVVDASGLVAQRCPASGGTAGKGSSEFVVTGRGGLPPSPSDPLSSDAVQVDWVTLDPKMEEKRSGPTPATNLTSPTPVPLVEAQGWVRDSKGRVLLTAQAPTVTPHSPGLTPAACRGS